jgi:hypothetical protein
MMFATSGWVSSHPATAEAIDLAWIAAAKIFNTDENRWAAYANSYTAGTNSSPALRSAYTLLKFIGGFAVSESSFSRQAVATNATIAKNLGTLTKLGNRPLSRIVNTQAWTSAWDYYRTHEAAF